MASPCFLVCQCGACQSLDAKNQLCLPVTAQEHNSADQYLSCESSFVPIHQMSAPACQSESSVQLICVQRLTGIALCSNLAGQQLSGQLPLDQRVWGALPAVTSVDLNNNAIQGYVPPQLDQLHQVQSLNLGNNGLQGPLPSLSNLSSVQNVTFSNNQLTGISSHPRASGEQPHAPTTVLYIAHRAT